MDALILPTISICLNPFLNLTRLRELNMSEDSWNIYKFQSINGEHSNIALLYFIHLLVNVLYVVDFSAWPATPEREHDLNQKLWTESTIGGEAIKGVSTSEMDGIPPPFEHNSDWMTYTVIN